MTESAEDLARELQQLQRDYRAYARNPDYDLSEVWQAEPGGFVDKYQRRTKEIQEALASRHRK